MKIVILCLLSILNFPHSYAPERGSVKDLERVELITQFITTVRVQGVYLSEFLTSSAIPQAVYC
jgi:hypothetical protein